jgi:hypothetical protein
LALVACSSETTPEAFHSGTRLRARYDDGGGGARSFIEFVDSQLGVRCAFTSADDGRMRCLPLDAAPIIYTDSSCTRPVAPANNPCPGTFTYATQPSSMLACPFEPMASMTTVYALGSMLPQLPVYDRRPDGSCVSMGMRPVYAVTALPATMFVAANERVESRTSELGVRFLDAEDGASIAVGLYDQVRRAPCAPVEEGPTTANVARCLPAAAWAPEYFFADAMCIDATRVYPVRLPDALDLDRYASHGPVQ